MTLPEVPAGDLENKPLAALTTTKANYGIAADELKKAKAAYYAGISYFDAQIGKLLDQLEEKWCCRQHYHRVRGR